MAKVFHYGVTERLTLSPVTTVTSSAQSEGRLVRIIATASIFFARNADANITTCPYVPYNAELILSVGKGDTLSFLAEPNTVGDQYVYISEVTQVL